MRLGLAIMTAAALAGTALSIPRLAMAAPQDEVAPAPDVRPVVRARTRIYISPRQPGPNSRRICQSWLAQEYRPSGTVITPQMRCYWD